MPTQAGAAMLEVMMPCYFRAGKVKGHAAAKRYLSLQPLGMLQSFWTETLYTFIDLYLYNCRSLEVERQTRVTLGFASGQ